jgi:hypothetical protein
MAFASLTGCGGSDGGSGTVVARVGHRSITRGTLSHWMAILADGDFQEHVGRAAPKGLVSDPPSYPTCVSAVEALGPPKAPTGGATRVRAQLEHGCQMLYQGLKEQALSYLIEGLWSSEEAAELGITVTNGEVRRRYTAAQTGSERSSTQATRTTATGDRGLSHSDELYLLKRSLLATRLNEMRERTLQKQMKAASGEALQRALVERYAESVKKWPARTRCSADYMVAQCAHYEAPAKAVPSPAVLLEQIAASR